MFERYTEGARRVIFFARYEASQFGSPYIETEHLLLGVLRQDKALFSTAILKDWTAESIRQEIEAKTQPGEKFSTSIDLPLSTESKRVLGYAAEEAERLNDPHIGTEHLLLGLLREERCFAAALLYERGAQLSTAREVLSRQKELGVPKESSDRPQQRVMGEGRVLVSRIIEFQNDSDGSKLGETMAMDVPRIGEEIVLTGVRGRVTEVSYEYESAGRAGRFTPEKIVIRVQLPPK
jgi:ATP-dependent Clp protease ATP-binding subunit ClpC